MARNVNALFVPFAHDQIYSYLLFTSLYINGCTYVDICIYVYMYICIYIYIYRISYFKTFFYDLCVLSIFLNHPTLRFYANIY